MELGTYGLINVLCFSQGTGDKVSHTYPSPDNSVSHRLHSPFILTQAAITDKSTQLHSISSRLLQLAENDNSHRQGQ